MTQTNALSLDTQALMEDPTVGLNLKATLLGDAIRNTVLKKPARLREWLDRYEQQGKPVWPPKAIATVQEAMNSALTQAAKHNRVDQMQVLVVHGADPAHNGHSPLLEAVHEQHLEASRWLFEKGYAPKRRSAIAFCLQCAASCPSADLLDLCLVHLPVRPTHASSALARVCVLRDVTAVHRLLPLASVPRAVATLVNIAHTIQRRTSENSAFALRAFANLDFLTTHISSGQSAPWRHKYVAWGFPMWEAHARAQAAIETVRQERRRCRPRS
jgi:hypothetical protein